ncbi:hypothetical protein NXS19_003511 [Fusarium pseudograminearum]|nr:hypothetical protein NXS19_003511 [Fusarium pseudograminearum]
MSSQQIEFFKDNLPDHGEVTTPDSVPSSPELGSSSSSDSIASLGSPASPLSPAVSQPVADSFVFAFDIDGVLVRGGRAIPEALQAMKVLNGENEYGIQVPHIFLTNGGGKTEEERCNDLSGQLQCDIKPGQFICGHTPMREMAEKYGTVLVVGGEGEKCRHVAEGYGFKDVVTPGDIIKHNAATTPFRKLTPEEHHNSRERDFTDVVIDAVFVFADSRDWAGDIQIMLDVAMSKGGRLGTRSETNDEGPLSTSPTTTLSGLLLTSMSVSAWVPFAVCSRLPLRTSLAAAVFCIHMPLESPRFLLLSLLPV